MDPTHHWYTVYQVYPPKPKFENFSRDTVHLRFYVKVWKTKTSLFQNLCKNERKPSFRLKKADWKVKKEYSCTLALFFKNMVILGINFYFSIILLWRGPAKISFGPNLEQHNKSYLVINIPFWVFSLFYFLNRLALGDHSLVREFSIIWAISSNVICWLQQCCRAIELHVHMRSVPEKNGSTVGCIPLSYLLQWTRDTCRCATRSCPKVSLSYR